MLLLISRRTVPLELAAVDKSQKQPSPKEAGPRASLAGRSSWRKA